MRLNNGGAALVIAAAMAGLMPAAQAAIAVPGTVSYPAVPDRMATYSLHEDPALASRVAGLFDRDVADVQRKAGEISYFATVATQPAAATPGEDRSAAGKYFTRVLPTDEATQFAVGERFVVLRQEIRRSAQNELSRGDVVEEAAIIRADRFVGSLRVYGSGSVAVAELRGGRVVSSVIRWKVPGSENLVKTRSLNEKRLRAHVGSLFSFDQDVSVLSSPELVYVDDGRTLQPAYRVPLNVRRADGAAADVQETFIPAVEQGLSIPPSPIESVGVCTAPAQTKPGTSPIDRYVVNEERQWAVNASAFLETLGPSNGALTARNLCYLEERMLASDKAKFVDSATVALIESHGQPGRIQITPEGPRYMKFIDVGGYGTGEESLRLLVLHSCEVIATNDDDTEWFHPWFSLFGGLHTVLGYRTPMKISDGVSTAFAAHLRDDEPLIRSWFAEVASVPSYGNAIPPAPVPGAKSLGRAAAVTVCGEGQARPRHLKAMRAPDCLAGYWMKD
jgi:hypothetical protein